MLLALMFVLLLIFLVCRFVHFLKLKSTISILFGIAVFIGCCIIGAAIYISYYGYSHNLSVDRKKLESFYVDLDTAQQYEEWFCPDKRIVPIDDQFELYLVRKITISEEPYRWVDVTLSCYTDAESAVQGFNIGLKHTLYRYKTKKLNAGYEYAYIKTNEGISHDVRGLLVPLLPDGDYVSKVKIRYKNLVFEFTGFSDRRESDIGDAIDLLLADYEQYKKK